MKIPKRQFAIILCAIIDFSNLTAYGRDYKIDAILHRSGYYIGDGEKTYLLGNIYKKYNIFRYEFVNPKTMHGQDLLVILDNGKYIGEYDIDKFDSRPSVKIDNDKIIIRSGSHIYKIAFYNGPPKGIIINDDYISLAAPSRPR